jgi:hypothetical protein
MTSALVSALLLAIFGIVWFAFVASLVVIGTQQDEDEERPL